MSPEEKHSEFTSLVTRKLSGEITPDEMLHLQRILSQDPGKQAQMDEFHKIWETVGTVKEQESYDLEAEWNLMQEKLPGVGSGSTSSRRSLFFAYRIAAVLVIGLLSVFSWYYVTRVAGTEQVIAENAPVEVLLEDGTMVTVNRDSRIRYKKKFSSRKRRISLTGEAWFDVARDTLRPFLIDAGSAMVKVLGTRFNVNAYKENATVEITVESGVVAVSSKQDKQDQIVLKAGNGGTYSKENKELTLISSSDPNNLSWKTRELFFNNSSLWEVVSLVNKVYNTHLVIANKELTSCPITVTFRDQTLEAVLNVLETTLDLEISRSGQEIRLDGRGCDD